MKIDLNKYLVGPGKKVKLADFATSYHGDLQKEQGILLLKDIKKEFNVFQEKLYASANQSLLVVFQAMDAAGKDSTIEHVFSGINPQGCEVANFKAPNAAEYAHDFLWRHYLSLPARGKIGIHNRSHYENVLVSRVHPEILLKENLPATSHSSHADFWKIRYESIRDFEKHISRNGIKVIKIFLHLSKDEQKKRFLKRITEADKNWKFAAGDLKEREMWDDYQRAYQQAISATSTKDCPWYIVPADKKWFARLVVASIVQQSLKDMNLEFPSLNKEMLSGLGAYKKSFRK
ncbi:MAG: polyphosphate kinase 2 family protein [Bacteroidota bacterium]